MLMNPIAFSADEYFQRSFQRIDLDKILKTATSAFQHFVSSINKCYPHDWEIIFGDPSFRYITWRRLSNWCFNFDQSVFIVSSSKEKGTTIETDQNQPYTIETVFKFIVDLYDHMDLHLNKRKLA